MVKAIYVFLFSILQLHQRVFVYGRERKQQQQLKKATQYMLNIDSIQLCGSYALFSLRTNDGIQMESQAFNVKIQRK